MLEINSLTTKNFLDIYNFLESDENEEDWYVSTYLSLIEFVAFYFGEDVLYKKVQEYKNRLENDQWGEKDSEMLDDMDSSVEVSTWKKFVEIFIREINFDKADEEHIVFINDVKNITVPLMTYDWLKTKLLQPVMSIIVGEYYYDMKSDQEGDSDYSSETELEHLKHTVEELEKELALSKRKRKKLRNKVRNLKLALEKCQVEKDDLQYQLDNYEVDIIN